jgi:plasmid replication initiation protein
MRKLFVRLLKRLTKSLDEAQEIICQSEEIKGAQETPKEELQTEAQIIPFFPIEVEESKKQEPTQRINVGENKRIVEPKKKAKEPTKTKKKLSAEIIEFDPRDMMEVMEVPFLALSKNRTKPIIYQSKDGKTKVKVSAHTEHYVASIYDWDIILLVSAKMQEIINLGSDIPARTLIIPRNEILRALHKHNGKKQEKDLKESLARLKFTGIETTIRNENGRYDAGFGFLDSWGYTERKDLKEIQITLSQWLYDGVCKKGSLLKVSQGYFDLTSGLKKFLYRTARKHVGNNNQWEFSIEKLYEKSGSEQIFRFFKRDLKKAILDNDIPEYFLEWIEDGNKTSIRFSNKKKELTKMLAL